MNWLNRLNRKWGRYGIDSLMIYVTVTMLAIYLTQWILNIPIYQYLYFSRPLILSGQIWRVVTFLFLPPVSSSFLLVLISLYFFYFIGNSLEDTWGRFYFTVYYLLGAVGAIIAGFISGIGDNTYLNLSLFLAFAQLFPDFEVRVFFLFPLKVKYLAYLDWGLFALSFIFGGWSSRAAILMSMVHFFVFFGPDIWRRFQTRRKYGPARRKFRQQNRDNPFNY
ncbi:rhomboid family intramembrane serine protease [Oscillospiraceae bacterium MB08-C2-2]|nr:rhomboid family intramembrane serine protease [Oscillospiraceae bacterium MB08-C2-2]